MHLFRHIDFPNHIRIPGIRIEDELKQLLKRMFYRKIDGGSYVYQIDDMAETVYIVLGGSVDVDGAGGQIARTVHPGGMFGEDAGQGAEECQRRKGLAIALEDTHLAGLDRVSYQSWVMEMQVMINRVYKSQIEEEREQMVDRFEKEATGHLRGFFSG